MNIKNDSGKNRNRVTQQSGTMSGMGTLIMLGRRKIMISPEADFCQRSRKGEEVIGRALRGSTIAWLEYLGANAELGVIGALDWCRM